MLLLDWYRQWQEIKQLNKEPKVCDSCETLKLQLEIANAEKRQLLNRILEPTIQTTPEKTEPITVPKSIPWAVRKQFLEREDRERARLLRDSPKESVEDLEKELGIASERREKEAAN